VAVLQSPPRRPLTPLWVIALFLSLTETVLGIGVIQTTGGIQIALTAFVMFFPTLVAMGFFAILWSRAYVLYPPTEYGGQVDVRHYVDAIRGKALDEAKEALATTKPVPVVLTPSGEPALEIARDRSTNPNRSVNWPKKLLVDGWMEVEVVAPFVPEELIRTPYARLRTVDVFLTWIGGTAENKFVFTSSYGSSWILLDPAKQHVFRDIGPVATGDPQIDDIRSLKDVGIQPSVRLHLTTPGAVRHLPSYAP
jgi:hypothetical protein